VLAVCIIYAIYGYISSVSQNDITLFSACLVHSGPEVLFKTCVAMKFVDDDDDDVKTDCIVVIFDQPVIIIN